MPSRPAASLRKTPTAQRESGRPWSRPRLRGGSRLAEVAQQVNRCVDRKRRCRHILCCLSARLSCTQRDSTTTTLQRLRGMPVERVWFSSLPSLQNSWLAGHAVWELVESAGGHTSPTGKYSARRSTPEAGTPHRRPCRPSVTDSQVAVAQINDLKSMILKAGGHPFSTRDAVQCGGFHESQSTRSMATGF
jgi:hypothetical protein